jgi:hypothetical protein
MQSQQSGQQRTQDAYKSGKKKSDSSGLTNYQQYLAEKRQTKQKHAQAQQKTQPAQKKKTNILTSLLKEIEEHNKETQEQGQNMDHL